MVAASQSGHLIGTHLAVFLVALSIICGLVSFLLCLAGEAYKSQTWYLLIIREDGFTISECFYNGSGINALVCAICAFLLLPAAMFAEHAYMLVAVTRSTQTEFALAFPEDPRLASSAQSLTKRACFLLLLTWICFAIAEVLLMICIGVESGHLNDWTKPRSVCHTIRPGLFTAAGILGLIAVFLGFMMYLTALRMQRLHNIYGTMHHGDQVLHGLHNLAPTAPVEQHQCMPHQHPQDQGPHNLAPTAPHEQQQLMPDEAPTDQAETVATSV
ncbi:hypothetical protein LUZ60_009518 [Juncus effusus]|nr:hypothetical protein LUZ60_009518 [Juncus effusus]